jgi:hypothetical protein
LDVAVGSVSVEMTKYLFEFHGAKPTRETLKQAISTGNFSLIKLMRDRLPEGELLDRVDLLEVAAEFHQPEVLGWLLRDATVFERELLGVFALEGKLADSLVVALESGFQPWWSRTRELSLKGRPSSEIRFVSAPDGFSADGGWWTSFSGATSALRAHGSESWFGSTMPDRALRVRPSVGVEWTSAMSQAQMDDANLVKSVVFPSGVIAIGERAFCGFGSIESVVFPASYITFGESAFEDCKALKIVSFPVGCKATGRCAFCGCEALVNALIPAGCAMVSECCFMGSASLTGVRFPCGLRLIGNSAFFGCAIKVVTLPDGCEVAECAFYRCVALMSVAIGRECKSVGEAAFQYCQALATVTIGAGCLSVGDFAFDQCSLLVSVALPSSVRSIGFRGFGGCTSLATIDVPESCQVDERAFTASSPRMTRF